MEIDHIFQDFAALELSEYGLEGRSQLFAVDVVEEGSHMGIGGNTVDMINGMEIIVVSSLVEGEQRRVFEGE